MEKETILIVHNYYKQSGGEDSVVRNEKQLLEENGHKVVLYSRNNQEIDGFGFFKKLFFPFVSVFNFRTHREIKKIIKKEQIDIVHVHNTLALISPSVYYVARKMKKPVVQTVHNFRLLCPGATLSKNGEICEQCINKGLRRSIKNKCYHNSFLQTLICVISMKFHRLTGIYKKINYICLTEFNKRKLLNHRQINESQIFVKPNFSSYQGKVVPLNEREDYFVFLARVEKIKGVEFLLKSWCENELRGKRLIVCGDGPLLEWAKEFATENGLNGVEFKGKVSHEDGLEILGKAKALILPTQWYEGFPMTIVESLSLGTPVIGPDMGNVGNLIVDGKNGYKYAQNDTKDFIDKISGIDGISSIGSEVINGYSKEANYAMLKNIYESVKK